MSPIGYRNDVNAVAAAAGITNVSFNEQSVDSACSQHHWPNVTEVTGHHDAAVRVHAPPLRVGKAGGTDVIEINLCPCCGAEAIEISLIGRIERAGNRHSER